MTALLDAHAAAAVRERVASLERATGVELVAAVVARSDSYPEIPWKAFAAGASFGAAGAAALALAEPGWEAFQAVAESAVAVLASGGACALLAAWVEPFARLFLPRERREAEVLQYAQATFLEAGLHRARRHNAILLLVSLFERQVVVLPDSGVSDRLASDTLAPVVDAVTARLAGGNLERALLDGIACLEQALDARGLRGEPGQAGEISDDVLQPGAPS